MTLEELSKQRQAQPELGITPVLHIQADEQTIYVLDEPINLKDSEREDHIQNLSNPDVYELRRDYNQIIINQTIILDKYQHKHRQEASNTPLNTLRRIGTHLAASDLDRRNCYIQLESIITSHATGAWIAQHASDAHKQLTDKPIQQGLADTLQHEANKLSTAAARAYNALTDRMRAYTYGTPQTLEEVSKHAR